MVPYSAKVSRRSVLVAGAASMGLFKLEGGTAMSARLEAADSRPSFDQIANALGDAVDRGLMSAAVMMIRHAGIEVGWAFGKASSVDSIFLLASISKPMVAAAVMALCDGGQLRLDDPVQRFLPGFRNAGRDQVTLRHLLSHCSGLPDQLPENVALRSRHAPLADFVKGAMTVPLAFPPGSAFLYSSMGILLAAEMAGVVSGMPMHRWIAKSVFEPLGMSHSSLGLGETPIAQTMQCQTESAAAESGAGDPEALRWDWNSDYWRGLGAPWGGVHGSARDVLRFMVDFLEPSGKMLKPETSAEMIRRQIPAPQMARGLGFGLGRSNSSRFCSQAAFGHTGSTGTLTWADPQSSAACVVLTTLPGGAVDPHPRQVASDQFAQAIKALK
jgi:CubicO group peptidase (beta-lactamase class C family)